MKGGITTAGILFIERKGEGKEQECPMNHTKWCGDWCSLFGEPVHYGTCEYSISLCKKEIKFKRFIDSRDQP